MKWTTHELKKLSRTNNQFSFQCNCEQFLDERDADIVSVSPADVKGSFRLVERDGLYVFDVNITCHLTMLCALSLREVDVPLSFDTTITFAENVTEDYMHAIDGLTIDLDPYVWSEIMIEKPMKVISAHAREEYEEDIEEMTEEEKAELSPFATLKDKIK